MNLDDYIADREARDPEFRAIRAASRSVFEFQRALIGARLATGLTQTQLARAIGTRQPAIARLESGEARPSFDMLVRLAKALQVTFEISSTGTIEATPVATPALPTVASASDGVSAIGTVDAPIAVSDFRGSNAAP